MSEGIPAEPAGFLGAIDEVAESREKGDSVEKGREMDGGRREEGGEGEEEGGGCRRGGEEGKWKIGRRRGRRKRR